MPTQVVDSRVSTPSGGGPDHECSFSQGPGWAIDSVWRRRWKGCLKLHVSSPCRYRSCPVVIDRCGRIVSGVYEGERDSDARVCSLHVLLDRFCGGGGLTGDY